MDDKRFAKNLALTRYFPRGLITAGVSLSRESDYKSRAFSLTTALSTEDKLTTFHFGVGLSSDQIKPNGMMVDETKKIIDLMFGVTQVFTSKDIAQINLTYSNGHGYYSDPYKLFGEDRRPRNKHQTAVFLRWNRYFKSTGGTNQLGYRFYNDSFGIQAHTLSTEYSQPLPGGWTLTPEIRLYSQTAADFYVDPDPAVYPLPTLPQNFIFGQTLISEDQRLSAFGARTFGLKITKAFDHDWTVDVKYQDYEQRDQWQWNGQGSPRLNPFRARIWQVGFSHAF